MATFREHIAHILSKGVATTNRFEVQIGVPAALQKKLRELNSESSGGGGGSLSNILISTILPKSKNTSRSGSLSIMVDEIPLPGKTLPTTDIRYNSDVYRMPYGSLYDTQTIVFGCTSDMYEKFVIDLWLDCIFDPNNHEIEYQDQYATTIKINFLDKQDRTVHSVTWEDAYPIAIDPVQLSNSNASEYAKISATFTFKRWKPAYEFNDPSSVSGLSQTPLGPFITPILSNPIVQGALETLEEFTGIDLEGEGVAIYNQIDSIMKGATGTSINKLSSILNGILSDIESNSKLSTSDQRNLVELVQRLLGKLKG